MYNKERMCWEIVERNKKMLCAYLYLNFIGESLMKSMHVLHEEQIICLGTTHHLLSLAKS